MNHSYQLSTSKLQGFSRIRHARTGGSWLQLVGLLAFLLLPSMACGFITPQYETNNDVRLAIYEYERDIRGKTDDLVIDFQRDEPRIKFEGQSENGGRTVWLYRLGAEEFFALRRPEATYLYIQGIEYDGDHRTATARVFRGDGSGFEGRILTLKRAENNRWSVINEAEMIADESRNREYSR